VAESSPSKNNPCLDIVLASYNGQDFIAEQLCSLQLCFGYAEKVCRVLVVDDASDDHTAAIVADFSKHDSRIVWFPSLQGRQGVVANFARGLNLSTAPYVMLCDQDDVWLTDKIRLQLDCLQRYEEQQDTQEPVLVFSDLHVVNRELQQLSRSFFAYQNLNPQWAEKFSQLLLQNVAPGCTMLLNRLLLEKALPFPPQVMMHDWWLMLVARAFGQILWLDQPLVEYRQHRGNQVGAQAVNWRWMFSLRQRCVVAAENLRRQGRQALTFHQFYRDDSALLLDVHDRKAVQQIGQLPESTLRQRLNGFVRGTLRKNSFLRNAGLLLVLLFWPDKPNNS